MRQVVGRPLEVGLSLVEDDEVVAHPLVRGQ